MIDYVTGKRFGLGLTLAISGRSIADTKLLCADKSSVLAGSLAGAPVGVAVLGTIRPKAA